MPTCILGSPIFKKCFFGFPGFLLLGLISFSSFSFAEVPRMDTVLYGASYYHEYMPYDRLEKDVELMEKAGISVIRLGESTWTSWEPREGEFEFAWMERILGRLHKAGIKVILGTPTYSIPPWLYKKHPEVLAVRLGNEKNGYGLRQNMDITNPTYLFYCERVIRQIISHFKEHPAVIGYQIDNETSPYGTAGSNVQVGFVNYLKNKFKSIDDVNRAWGLVYWGQLVNDWNELPPREGIVNPGYKLEWARYQQKLCTDFLAWQAKIVNEYKRPDQFVTQDFSAAGRMDVNEWDVSKSLDVVAANNYHNVQDDLTGEPNALVGDFFRSIKHNNYLITETNAQTTGWDSKWQTPPYDGQLRLNVYSHLSSGANMVAYWHWHSLHYGQETYWKGVLSHDLEPNRAYEEVSRIAHELKKVGPRLVNLKKNHKVAILYSSDSANALQFMPFSDRVDYGTILRQYYSALYSLNVGTDFVFPETVDLASYDVIVVPPLYIASDALLEKLAKYVENGGHLVLSFKSGFCNEYSTVRWVRMPGPLAKACGFTYQEFSTLKNDLPLRGDPFQGGDENRVSTWAEFLMPGSAKGLAYYDHSFFGKYPAITRNQFGKGTLTYEGTFLSDELQRKVLLDVLTLAKLVGPDQKLAAAIKVKHGVGNAGKKIHYYLNFSGQAQTISYPYAQASDLLSGKAVAKAQSVTLQPWDLVILEEN